MDEDVSCAWVMPIGGSLKQTPPVLVGLHQPPFSVMRSQFRLWLAWLIFSLFCLTALLINRLTLNTQVGPWDWLAAVLSGFGFGVWIEHVDPSEDP